jgi:predicted ATPase/serine phosphatase RsbU (regulator of sigma subunit)
MEKIKGYILTEKVAESRGSVDYRGRKENERGTVLVRLLKAKFPSQSEIARFKQEYELIRSLDLDGIVKTHEVLEYNDSFALVQEDFDGVSLKAILEKTTRSDVPSFLRTAAAIAETLGNLHLKDLIHRDIKPHNILIDKKSDRVKIANFGISALITHEYDEVYHRDVITGRLLYMSPEQTGRINTIVDYRTDLYSFGVTLYEMLTGTLPFNFYDPMEIIYSHIAVMPVPPAAVYPGIPAAVSDIVMRLLSKTPEDRYQNAFGVRADLAECIRRMDERGEIEPFELARHDVSHKFIIPQRLCGREKEIDILISTFEKVAGNDRGSAIVAVSGAPGIGKSALVREILKLVVAKRGYFISGKYEQFRRDKPYSAVIQAFQALVRQILSESEEMLKKWREDLLSVLGPNGRVITDVIPDIALIIGNQPGLPALGAEETSNRFNFVFERFAGVFPSKEHPVALFLDDLQWADRASFQLLSNMIMSSGIRNFLLVLSYRDTEVYDAHPLTEFLKNGEKNNIAVERLTLGPLAVTDIKNFIINFLKCSDEKGAELADLVNKKTGGNPFFINQFLSALYNEKLIVQDGGGGWRWDADKIGSMQVTDNLVELMAGKIGKLSSKTQEVLKICACIGNRFDLETVASVRGTSIDAALNDLGDAVREALVSPLGDMYIFHHDRIHEAAYSLVSDREKSELHYRIGTLLLEKSDDSEMQNKLFYIVDQLNMGASMITGAKEREEIARLNLEAGKKAKTSAAYAPAFRYLKSGMDFLEKDSWDLQYELTLALQAESAETAYLMGDFDAMNKLSETGLRNARTILDRVKLHISRINACIAREDFSGAIDTALPIVRELGVRIPKKATQLRIGIELAKVRIGLLGKRPDDLLDLPKMTDPEKLAAGQILSSMAHAAFYADPNMLALVILKSLGRMLKHGHAPDTPFSLIGFGFILGIGLGDFEGAMKFGRLGLRLLDRLNAREYESRSIFVFNAIIRHWVEPIKETIASLLEGYRIGMETGDLDYAGFNLFFADAHSLYAGMELSELERSMAKNNQIIAGLNQKHLLTLQSISWQSVLNLLGQCPDPLKLTGKAIDAEMYLPVWMSVNNRAALSTFWFAKLTLYSLYNELSLALEAAEQFKKYKDSMQGVSINRNAVFHDSRIRIFLYPNASLLKKIEYRIQMRINQIKMKKWADSAPMNSLFMLHGIEALYAWHVRGDMKGAERSFDLAIRLCREYDNVIHEALINESAVKFYLARGNENKAREHMSDACASYKKWGATGLLNRLLKTYPHLALPSTPAGDSALATAGTGAVSLDLSTIMKASHAISGEIVLEKLLVSMIRILMENAGAQKAFMILEEKGRFFVEAEGNLGSGNIPVLTSIPVDSHKELSPSIVNYVARTNTTVMLNDASSEGEFVNDPYIVEHKPKSILCSAVLNQGKLSAIIYLENNLAAGVFTPERLEILSILSSQIAISIDNAKLYENLEEKVRERTEELRSANEQLIITKNALWGELELAKKIQTVLLPKNPEIPGYEISAYMMPAFEVGGDYYDFIHAGGRHWIAIGDVSGHGVTAGLVMMMAQTAIHTALSERPDMSPSDLLIIINRAIETNITKMNQNKFMTITALAAQENGQFIFSGRHQNIMVYRARTGDVDLVETNGIWLGVFEEIKGKVYDQTLTLAPGDVMMLYTDGVTEAWHRDATGTASRRGDVQFGEKRLKEILRSRGGAPPDGIQKAVLNAMRDYTSEDDVTIVLVKRTI